MVSPQPARRLVVGNSPAVWTAERASALVDAVQEGVIMLDDGCRVVAANPMAGQMLGLTPGQLSGQMPLDVDGFVFLPDGSDCPGQDHPWMRCLTSGLPQADQMIGVGSAQHPRWLLTSSQPVHSVDRTGSPEAVVCTLVDVTRQQAVDASLEQAEERFRLAFDMAPTGNALVAPDGSFLRVNAEMATMLGVRQADLLDTPWSDIVRPEDRPDLTEFLDNVLADTGAARAELRMSHSTGRPLHCMVTGALAHQADGRPAYIIVQIKDVTARKLAQAALTHQATHDSLTGLPNRTLLLDRLGHALRRSRRNQTHVALLFCDVDRFKRINDSLGHDVGDILLVEVARRLRTCIRDTDTAGRLGGDEFLIVCEELAAPEDAMLLAERVRAATDQPIDVVGESLAVTLSIGVALAGADDDPATLLRRADTAMYEAKERGRARFEVFDETLRDRARERLTLESELRSGIAGDQLRVYHQPVVDLIKGRIIGREALVRWEHPQRGLLPPAAFLEVAEESDLVVDLGCWMLEEACRQGHTMALAERGRDMAINVSARQLGRPDFRRRVENALEASGLRPDQLILELTETSLLSATSGTLADVESMSREGIRLAVDDFGTGYSSLTYLQKLPVGVVKIDRSFVADMAEDPKRRAIAKAVISLGQALELEVVAEGVETREQADLLVDMGCVFAQGYLFGRPMPMETMTVTI